MVVAIGDRDNRTMSIPFNFRRSDFTVLQFEDKEVSYWPLSEVGRIWIDVIILSFYPKHAILIII